MDHAFFPPTRAFLNEFERVNAFVWPTAAAMWNLRWQVKGFKEEVPDVSPSILRDRFTAGSGVLRVDFDKVISETWEQQLSQFGEMTLMTLVSLFEGWLSEMQSMLAIDTKALQFPSMSVGLRKSKRGKPLGGVKEALASAGVRSSNLMEQIYSPLFVRKHYSLPKIDALLVCYRYWKEVRNCIAHGNRRASQQLLDAQAELSKLKRTDLGTKVIPDWTSVSFSDAVPVTLRGVMGFTEVILKIAVTIDAELATTDAAERLFVKEWVKARVGDDYVLPADERRRRQRMASIGSKTAFGSPTPVPELAAVLMKYGAV